MILSHWRGVLARLPLPMLALAASYGVFEFARLFVPFWVALVQAAAFELTYVGLAVAQIEPSQRRRARLISIGAVVVSVLYNTLAGLFHRRPDLLLDLPIWADVALALLHGAPLAWVAFLVADLLLHQPLPETAQSDDAAIRGIAARNSPKTYQCKRCGAGPFDFGELGRHSRVCRSIAPDPEPVNAAD
ncbi:MAG: hypothetical protein AB4911_12665 [Oscillochloridaceae bacterium umkhey_bin13]